MTQEEKSLLIQDLSARLPYDLYVRVEEFNVSKNEAITEGFVGNYLKDNRCNDYDVDGIINELADDCIDVKPYLRPLSSMTEEELKEFYIIEGMGEHPVRWSKPQIDWHFSISGIDYLLSHHFDYRGLIEKGLALIAPEGMYKLKEK